MTERIKKEVESIKFSFEYGLITRDRVLEKYWKMKNTCVDMMLFGFVSYSMGRKIEKIIETIWTEILGNN